jgi:type I restriction-modification system DNA methylase subunit
MFVFFYDTDSGVAVLDKPAAPTVQQPRKDWQKQFIDVFKRLTYRHQSWRVWSDYVEMSAIAICNVVNTAEEHDRLEKRYLEIVKNYNSAEIDEFTKLLAILTQALEDNPEQDFLGTLFQELELSSHWKGQFFTPYNLCRAIAEIQTGDLAERVRERGYVSVNDPACGAGAMLIAFANAARVRGVNYQNQVLFVAQDIDRTAALMCYLQLSLLGCAGYVIVGDTLSRPGLHPENDVWYTPMWFSDIWLWRRFSN